MTTNTSNDYAPFFSDGRLFLPEKTLELLMSAGLDSQIAHAAQNGLALDDDRAMIGQISDLLVRILNHLAETHPEAYEQLSNDTTAFMLTGKPSRSKR